MGSVAIVAGVAICLAAAGALVRADQAARSAARAGSTCAVQSGPPGRARTASTHIGLPAWTMFQAFPGHNLVLAAAAAAGRPLAVSWRFATKGEITTAPSVVDGVAYFGSSDHCVYALDVATGAELWAFQTDNVVMSEPLVVDGRVFVGSGNKTVLNTPQGVLRGSGPSAVYGLDAATGRALWTFRTLGEVMPTLLYQNGVVYAATGDSHFYALDAASGRLLWKVRDGSVDSMSSVAVDGNTAVFGGADPYAVYGVGLSSHAVAWKTPLGKGTPWDAEGGIDDVSPTISGSLAYVQNPEGIFPKATVVEFALNASTGRITWQTELGSGTITVADREETGVATVTGGTLYVGSPAVPGVWALNARNGAPLWKAPVPQGLRSTPTVTARYVYAAGSGWVWVLDRATGAVLRAVHLSSPPTAASCASPPVTIVGQTALVLGGNADTLMAVPLSEIQSGAAGEASN